MYPLKTYANQPISIVAFGDSLTAGYLLQSHQAFPKRLEKSLKDKGYNVNIINSGVSGDTTSAGLSRLDWSIPKNTHAVIIELGANDVLRGIPPTQTKQNLDKIIQKLKSKNIEVLLTGMKAPKSYGDEYVKNFRNIYSNLSKKYDTLLYPFFLKGVALKSEYNLSDGIHPNPEGVDIIVKNILPFVEQLIARVEKKN